ncbi:MAG: MATE family efflux transporter [Dysosmobacter sp.]|nr:MATE family efflux transporter [Dysosmobacter sp.]MDY3281037.1 MATE family efflux transporter [Dysosmobacter sp.]
MTQEPVGRLICRMAVPCIISMMITAFYNMADTFFVGLLNSNSATGAVGVAFSLMAVIQAVGFFFGHGSGNYVSRELGRQNPQSASEMASTGFALAVGCGAALALLGILLLTPLVRLLGATETILPYAKSYVRIILLGTPWMTGSLTLNNLLRFQGSAMYGMVGVTAGAVLNIALDPLLIFYCHLGIAGAALATIISQFVGFCILLWLCSRGSNLRLHLSNVRPCRECMVQIARGGLPSLCRQGFGSIGMIVLNHSAGIYGDAAIAAMTVANRAMQTASSALIGFGQGFQPVCGFNYGARLWNRVREGFWFCIKVSTGFLLLLTIPAMAFAPRVIALFRDDPQVIAYGAAALRYQCTTFALSGWVVCCNMTLQTVGRTGPASVLAVSRQGLCLIPALLILTPLLGFLGVQLAQPVADVATFLIALAVQIPFLRELKAGPSPEKS